MAKKSTLADAMGLKKRNLDLGGKRWEVTEPTVNDLAAL